MFHLNINITSFFFKKPKLLLPMGFSRETQPVGDIYPKVILAIGRMI